MQVCRKAGMPPESKEPCSLFLSPNGKTFQTMDEVAVYAKVLDEEKLARNKKKLVAIVMKNWKLDEAEDSSSQSKDMAAKKQKLDKSDAMPSQAAFSSTLSIGKLKCVECDNSFFNLSRLEKHFKDIHVEASQLPSSMEHCTICNIRLVNISCQTVKNQTLEQAYGFAQSDKRQKRQKTEICINHILSDLTAS